MTYVKAFNSLRLFVVALGGLEVRGGDGGGRSSRRGEEQEGEVSTDFHINFFFFLNQFSCHREVTSSLIFSLWGGGR